MEDGSALGGRTVGGSDGVEEDMMDVDVDEPRPVMDDDSHLSLLSHMLFCPSNEAFLTQKN